MTIVWLGCAMACLAGQADFGPSPLFAEPSRPAVSTGFPTRLDSRWDQVSPSLNGPGMLLGEPFHELPETGLDAGRNSAPHLVRLASSRPPVRLTAASAASTEYFQPSTAGSRETPRTLQFLPDGLIYRSYLAGAKESRMGSAFVHDRRQGWMWDITLGGRVGILRLGTEDTVRPEGWQLDIEGASLPRLDLENGRDLTAVDFRFGVPLTYGRGRYQTKFAYYHLSSHLGDEYMVRNATLTRRNYARDVFVWGHSLFLTDAVRLYAEVGWAFFAMDGSEPWEFQFGIDYSPVRLNCPQGTPFFAINGHLREEVDFGGNVVVQTGWQWRGDSGHLFRVGMQYFNGMSDQFEFYDQYEDKLGVGIWYDY